ncbi:hypothetical protein [Paraburkholderia sp.]|uniref:hypothetical protein n=1 Tax=Paraburkholderia sp. TaxID=1926495 RepID=UPI00238459E1|nr:hypothetical protein [Paraburkholderia sp.]MDE1184023.1 hypothetical protein [Paraburkholderia sp.]
MAERVSGPYRGYYISAAARLVPSPEAAPLHGGKYVGSVSLAQHGPDDPRRVETLIDLGDEQRFATDAEALDFVEQAARTFVDRLIDGAKESDALKGA